MGAGLICQENIFLCWGSDIFSIWGLFRYSEEKKKKNTEKLAEVIKVYMTKQAKAVQYNPAVQKVYYKYTINRI